MKKIIDSILVLLPLIFITLVVFDNVSDFDKGLDAAKKGDYKTALNEFFPLAQQGDSVAQFMLGVMYVNGEGVIQDDKQAVHWYRKAAEQGYASAQHELGIMYTHGRGVIQDDKQAMHWYRKASEQGNTSAQFMLGSGYADGKGVVQDYKKSYMWFDLAKRDGDENTKVGLDYISGLMTPDEIAQAQNASRVCLESNYKKCD